MRWRRDYQSVDGKTDRTNTKRGNRLSVLSFTRPLSRCYRHCLVPCVPFLKVAFLGVLGTWSSNDSRAHLSEVLRCIGWSPISVPLCSRADEQRAGGKHRDHGFSAASLFQAPFPSRWLCAFCFVQNKCSRCKGFPFPPSFI